MKTSTLLLLSLGLLAGCERSRVNPPTEPAKAIESQTMDAMAEAPSDSMAPMLPGAGPTSFVGRWSTDPSWCAAPQGQNRPIEITTMRFEGPGASCDIAHIEQVTGGYQATLACPVPGGMPKVERVQMSVVGQTLELAYVDRGPRATNPPVKLTKCTTLTDTSTKGPAIPVP
jgi:hypothetical protein